MKIKIAILGSTGSIGKSTIEILRKDKKETLMFSCLPQITITEKY